MGKNMRYKCPFCNSLTWGSQFHREPTYEAKIQESIGGRNKGGGWSFKSVPIIESLFEKMKQVWFKKIVRILDHIDPDFEYMKDFLDSGGYLEDIKRKRRGRVKKEYINRVRTGRETTSFSDYVDTSKEYVAFEQEL